MITGFDAEPNERIRHPPKLNVVTVPITSLTEFLFHHPNINTNYGVPY